MSEELRACWSRSKAYRVILTVVLIFAFLRLAMQGVYLGMLLFPQLGLLGGTPDWVGNEEGMVPADLQIYLDAAGHFKNRDGLYLQGSLVRLEDHYPYAPAFAFAFVPFLWLSPEAVTVIHTFLHIAAYALLYVTWGRIFDRLGLRSAKTMLAWTLPVWLLFSAFWGDLAYLNIYLIMTLIGSLFIEAVVNERLGLAVLWLSVIVQIKPHWAFAAVVPLLLGRYRFFLKLLGLTLVVYLAVMGALMTIAGPEYICHQYVDYVQFLGRLSRDFPWRGPDAAFLGYNHSIKQTVLYLLGVGPKAMRLADLVKLFLLLPLGWVSLRSLLNPVDRAGYTVPMLSLDLVFALYLGAFIWLDMVWEVSLGVVIFPYLLATTAGRGRRVLLWTVFLPYVLVDLWQAISFAVWGMDVIAPGPYILTDPSLYAPMMMIVIVTFYALLLTRLWRSVRGRAVSTCDLKTPDILGGYRATGR
ncbi:MAG: hypothetical protein ACP5JG_04110 [Anaerolineae bacterium]